MTRVWDLADPATRAEAIAIGIVWHGPGVAQEAACEDIASGRVPMPDYPLPPEAEAYIAELQGQKTLAEPKPEMVTGGGVASGWTCPAHGAGALVVLTSRKGRRYRACRICRQFEREQPDT